MAKTLSNGYIKPETDDTGDTYFGNLEDNIQRVNDHTHDGTDSELLTPTTIAISSSDWSEPTSDVFTKVIDVTDANSSFTYDTVSIELRLSDGTIIYPTVTKTTSTTYTISLSSAQALTALYT